MKVLLAKSFKEREKGDLLVIPYWEGPECASSVTSGVQVVSFLESGDFKGKTGETALLYLENQNEMRVLFLGIGSKKSVTVEVLRRSYAVAVRMVRGKKVKIAHFLFPKIDLLSSGDVLRGVCEGIFLANYAYHELKGEKENLPVLLEKVVLFGVDLKAQKQAESFLKIASSVYCVRNLVNANADEVDPKRLAKEARAMAGVQTTIFDRKQLEKEGMGLILAVGRGAICDPCMIQTSYRGDPRSKEHIVLVGKGITYDTGGLCLKTPDNMANMKCDMSGAAVVLETVKLAALFGLKINVTALAPAAENSIGPKSYKQGDIYRSFSGKTVEILNTDAEGRLVLADAIAYAAKRLQPSLIIDVATLTGAIVIALGESMAGFFANQERVAQELLDSSERTGEALWRMPLYDYKESLHSDIADLKNDGGREAGSMKAALFLQEFTENLPWAHIDLAGPSYITKPQFYYPTRGTGWGVRLLFDFLEKKARR